MATGITKRHARACRTRNGGRCNCDPSYEAWVYSPRDGKKIRKAFRREAEAKSWRADAKRGVDRGELRAAARTTIAESAGAWLEGAEAGEIRNRSGHAYKASTLRGYRQALELRVLPELGSRRLAAVTTADLQQIVDRWVADGMDASTLRNTVKPLQALYRRARTRGGLALNPTHDLELPAPRSKRVEIVAPAIAAQLLEAVSAKDRAVWATALYAGLRYGELRALRWGAVDVPGGTLEVRESWDPRDGRIAPKTLTSARRAPIPGLLKAALAQHRLASERTGESDLVFGRTAESPFHARTLYHRADRAWLKAGESEFEAGHGREPTAEDEVEPIGRLRLHQARHTYASFMIAAGVNAKALSAFMGHSSIKVTFDLYGHLMPGAEGEAAERLDAFLAPASAATAESLRSSRG